MMNRAMQLVYLWRVSFLPETRRVPLRSRCRVLAERGEAKRLGGRREVGAVRCDQVLFGGALELVVASAFAKAFASSFAKAFASAFAAGASDSDWAFTIMLGLGGRVPYHRDGGGARARTRPPRAQGRCRGHDDRGFDAARFAGVARGGRVPNRVRGDAGRTEARGGRHREVACCRRDGRGGGCQGWLGRRFGLRLPLRRGLGLGVVARRGHGRAWLLGAGGLVEGAANEPHAWAEEGKARSARPGRGRPEGESLIQPRVPGAHQAL
mmetsp:Transcript_52797/g.120338  ORF Transcript_52797/g.120338 Transcript_52797/m.120338 type:complete len:267 (-) Transcript_52797:91-891(-)